MGGVFTLGKNHLATKLEECDVELYILFSLFVLLTFY